jgi:Domain of unknown function (DUF4436)
VASVSNFGLLFRRYWPFIPGFLFVATVFVVFGASKSSQLNTNSKRIAISDGEDATWKAIVEFQEVDQRLLRVAAEITIEGAGVYSTLTRGETIRVLTGGDPSSVQLETPDSYTGADISKPFEVSFPMLGDPSNYPYDSYDVPISIGIESQFDLPSRPQLIEVRRLPAGFSSIVEADNPIEATVTLHRKWDEQIIFWLAAILMVILALSLVVVANRKSDQLITLLAALGVALAAFQLRSIIVPDELSGRNWLDAAAVIPLATALPVFAVVAFRWWNRRQYESLD